MWACGSDFQYQNADHWFHQLDKLIHYVNLNASKGRYVRPQVVADSDLQLRGDIMSMFTVHSELHE